MRRFEEWSLPRRYGIEATTIAYLGGIVGARLNWILDDPSTRFNSDILTTITYGGGMVFWGGLIGGTISVWVWAAWRGLVSAQIADLAAISASRDYVIGRIGCFLSGDGDYGKAWDGPFALAFPNGTVPTNIPVHPTMLYEALIMAVLAVFLWKKRDVYVAGFSAALYLIVYGVERFFIEFIRLNKPILLGLTQPQIIAFLAVCGGLLWIYLLKRQGPLERPPGPPPGNNSWPFPKSIIHKGAAK